jgi:hypothetical protein
MRSNAQFRHLARKALCCASALAIWGAAAVRGIVLDEESRVTLILKDGVQLTLFAEANPTPVASPPAPASPGSPKVRLRAHRLASAPTRNYYYLPANLRLSQRDDGTPEFLFLKFTTEQRADQGGVSGGLMHFLMTWGLTPEQEADAASRLQAKVGAGAKVMGAVPMLPEGEAGTFAIVSAVLGDRTMTPSLVTSGKAPLVPGGKAAAATRLSAEAAQLLAATFEKSRSITDVSIALNFAYETLTPAAKGTITFDWSKLEQHQDEWTAEYTRKETGRRKTEDCFLIFCASSDTPEYTYSYDEARKQFDFLSEKEVVKFDWQETLSDERVAKVRDAFFQYFLNSMAQASEPEPPPPADKEKDKDQIPDVRQGNGYHFSKSAFRQAFSQKSKTMSLDMRLAVRRPYQMVGNLASWYDGVRDNPRCVSAVNLNDPFFQHRDIHFILDLDAKEMFDEEVNYVTVNVRKKRSDGRPFEDHVTIDAKHLKEQGINSTVTYARGEDSNPDTYEYQAQWSLRGGNLFPPAPPWQKGDWEGVTLAPPVVPRTLEIEGDLDAMAANDITRVTVQIHYPQFGAEKEQNIHLSPAKAEPLVAQKIFVDRGSKGYAYRLIINHKTEGKLALPWSAQVGDDYIYASVPEDLLQNESIKQQAKDAAKDVVDSAKQKVLDQFKGLLGGGS